MHVPLYPDWSVPVSTSTLVPPRASLVAGSAVLVGLRGTGARGERLGDIRDSLELNGTLGEIKWEYRSDALRSSRM